MKHLICVLTIASCLGGCAHFATDLQNATNDLTDAAKTATTIAPTAATTASTTVKAGLDAGAAIIDGVIGVLQIVQTFAPLV